jgi:hypothetical protein
MPSASPSWRESDFSTRDRKNPRRWIGRAVVIYAFLNLLLLLNEQRRDGIRCDQDCYGEFITYEPGHAWTNYPDSWQWDAQNILMTISFLVAIAAVIFLFTHRRRMAVILTCVSLGLALAFIGWVQLSPPVGKS